MKLLLLQLKEVLMLAVSIIVRRKSSDATMENVYLKRTFMITIKIVQMDRMKTSVPVKVKCVTLKSTSAVRMDDVFHRRGGSIKL